MNLTELKDSIGEISHRLPSQGPIYTFIHHNTLHAFQHLPFQKAIQEASRFYGSKSLLTLQEYERLLDQGRIKRSVLERKLALRMVPSPKPIDDATSSDAGDLPAVAPLMVRLVSQFLDQGIAHWPFPQADSASFYDAVRGLFDGEDDLKAFNCPTPIECIAFNLDIRGLTDPGAQTQLLTRFLLSLRGWAGTIHRIENDPTLLVKARKISLEDWLAVYLTLDLKFRRRALHRDETLSDRKYAVVDSFETLWAYQTALEESFYEKVAATLKEVNRAPDASVPATTATPKVQAIFCIDDRECSFRRHLETEFSGLETFAYPGFFGVDMFYQRDNELFPTQRCPVVLTPKHLVIEKTRPDGHSKSTRAHYHRIHGAKTKTLLGGVASLPYEGIRSAISLISDVFFPEQHPITIGVDEVLTSGELEFEFKGKHSGPLPIGYTIEEMGARVAKLLRTTSLDRKMAPLVLAVAHGSSSVNNPYFAAYDCGACSGKPGDPNSRIFAKMANHPEVRKLLKDRHGISIPEGTWFVAAIHNTTEDRIHYFDVDEIPSGLRVDFDSFKAAAERALDRNAIERCQRFELAPQNPTPRRARKHVLNRARAIFEPRPELNHATNAIGIIGRRTLTRNRFLDRRAFLQSYDPDADPGGEVLAGILGPFIPVCAGINLEYFFSRIDPDVYGAGTKLPHNVASMIGVTNGAIGDLLTGLPIQMTEIHDPLRLLILIEQKRDIIAKVLKSHRELFDWVDLGWVHMGAIETDDNGQMSFFRWKNDDFQHWRPDR